jgi:hypothetical protein
LQRIEVAKQDQTPTAYNTILQNIRMMLQDVKDIDYKIIEIIQPSDIENEILQTEVYTLSIDIEISALEDYRKCRGYNVDNSDGDLYRQTSEPAFQLLPGIHTSQHTVGSTFSMSHKLPKLSLPTFAVADILGFLWIIRT